MKRPESPIIVIGNGPSILRNDFGEYIDRFPTVVRVNDWVTKGFESKVGSKTTHWVTGAGHQTKRKARSVNGMECILYLPLDRMVTFTIRQAQEQVRTHLYMDLFDFNLISTEIMASIEKVLKATSISTGLMALSLFMYHLSQPPVYILGFDGFTVKRHYYDNVGDVHISDRHQWPVERTVIGDLIKKGHAIVPKSKADFEDIL